MTAREPQIGERWTYTDTGESYWVTYRDDELVHLTNVETGEEVPPYPVRIIRNNTEYYWKYEGREESAFCGACEERLKAEDDYLCEVCRHGTEREV